MATHSSILAYRIPGMGEPSGLPSMGSHRVRQDWSDLAAAVSSQKAILFLFIFSMNCPVSIFSFPSPLMETRNPSVNKMQMILTPMKFKVYEIWYILITYAYIYIIVSKYNRAWNFDKCQKVTNEHFTNLIKFCNYVSSALRSYSPKSCCFLLCRPYILLVLLLHYMF